MNIKDPVNEASLRRTKIVATVGPASRSPEKLKQLIECGANVFRLNFSHGSHESHLEVLESIRSISSEINKPVAILQDLSGPKIRISNVKNDFETINDKQTVELWAAAEGELSDGQRIYVEMVDPVAILKPGDHILLADGIISLEAKSIEKDHVKCTIRKGGRIRSRVGIAFPDSDVNLPATTEKDLLDLSWGVKHGVDYVALSFVVNADDIKNVRKNVEREGGRVKIIAKIERKKALDNIGDILDVSDGLMVARGDLGLELPLEQLPLVQKRLIEEANYRGIPVIVATQMLHSMITSVRPTRAEVSDIAAAVMSGADAVMLSEETAIGENPLESVDYLGRIAREAERSFDFNEYGVRLRISDMESVPDAVAYAAAAAAVKVEASAVVACTETGTSARLIAKYRPQQRLFGMCRSETALRRSCLYWGVIPLKFPEAADDRIAELEAALNEVQREGKFDNGSWAVITGGLSVGKPGSTSVMEIRQLNTL